MSGLRPAGWGSGVAQGPQGCLWVVKVMAGRVWLRCGAMAPGPLWVIKFAAGGVGLGCEAMGPWRL